VLTRYEGPILKQKAPLPASYSSDPYKTYTKRFIKQNEMTITANDFKELPLEKRATLCWSSLKQADLDEV
jgi:hypothetical protein